MVNPLLSVEALTVERGGRIVLSKLSFLLHPGEIILVSGRNGAGKSTLLRTLCGLLAPVAGTIRFGLASDDVRGVETAHYLGYEDALKPALTVGENLDFWARMMSGGASSPARRGTGTMRSMVEGAPGDSQRPGGLRSPASLSPPPPSVPLPCFTGEDQGPTDALAAFGIARLAELPAAYLSAGQKRRVALARLLLNPRPIWLLDEPLIALDVATQATLTAIMARHVAQGGAILVASHQPLALAYREIDLAAAAA